MEEKHQDLKGNKQKKLVVSIVGQLNKTDPSLYYASTSEIAAEVKNYIEKSGKLVREEQALVSGLSQRDIQILLSLH